MSKFEDLIAAATYRLKPDPELRAEVSREIQAHLEDAMETARVQGSDADEAEKSAIAAFGDTKQLADQLWQANRGRMRLRAVAKWAFRLALMPAGILLAFWLSLATLDAIAASRMIGWFGPSLSNNSHVSNLIVVFDDLLRPLGNWRMNRLTSERRTDLTEEQRQFLAAMQMRTGAGRWDSLIQSYPDKPLYRVRQYAEFIHSDIAKSTPMLPDHPDVFARAKALLDAGEAADPNNAFWDYMRADLLMHESGAAKQAIDSDFLMTSERGATDKGMRLEFLDRAMFEEGLREYMKGLSKPIYNNCTNEYCEMQLALLPDPQSAVGEMQQIAITAGKLMPDLSRLRHIQRSVVAYAALLDEEGKSKEAKDILLKAPQVGTQMGASTDSLITLHIANSARQTALRGGAVIYERMGDADCAQRALALAEKESINSGVIWPLRGDREYVQYLREHAGFIGGSFFPALTVDKTRVITATSDAERYFVERAALGILSLSFLLIIIALAISTFFLQWRHRKDMRGPKLYFIGWKRLLWVLLIAVVLPLAGYMLMTRSLPDGTAHYGLNYVARRAFTEMAVTVVAILGLSYFLGRRASQARCIEAGLTDSKVLRRSRRHSLIPVLLLCLLVVGLVSNLYLLDKEREAVAVLQQPGHRLALDEVEYTLARQYRDYLRNLPPAWECEGQE